MIFLEHQAKKRFIIDFIFFGILILIIFVVGKFLLKYLLPFVIAFSVASIMQRPASLVCKKTQLKKGIAAAVLSALLYLAVAALLATTLYKVTKVFGTVFGQLPDLADKISAFVLKLRESTGSIFKNMSPDIKDGWDNFLESIFDSISGRLSEFLSYLATDVAKFAPSFILSSVVALVASCYIAKDYDGLMRFIKQLLGDRISQNIRKIKIIFKESVLKLLLGYLILTAITYVELFVGFIILDVKNAAFWAFAVAFIDLLPILGTGTVLMPWGLILIAYGNTFQGFGMILLYIVIVLIRNFAEPKIIGDKIGINPLFTLVTMFVGLRVFGFIGLIILPMVFIVVVKYYKNEMEEERALS